MTHEHSQSRQKKKKSQVTVNRIYHKKNTEGGGYINQNNHRFVANSQVSRLYVDPNDQLARLGPVDLQMRAVVDESRDRDHPSN
jgi:hypothetical protein